MNQCRAKVQLSVESVECKAESNLIKKLHSYVVPDCRVVAEFNNFYLVGHGNSTTYELGLQEYKTVLY